ncbi:MAG: PTS fructose IIA subunit family protein [Gammaproteobacteria bacterium]|nr:PTS fructose IIA subunit family protein [Gammaproteobacteria bacterium]
MNVGVLLLTQENIGGALLRAAQCQYEPLPLEVSVLAVNAEAGVEVFARTVAQRIEQLDTGGGVLVLTDAAGTAPHALAQAQMSPRLRIVSGLNLPMLLGLFKYPQRSLDELANVAQQAGRQGIADASRAGHGQPPLQDH